MTSLAKNRLSVGRASRKELEALAPFLRLADLKELAACSHSDNPAELLASFWQSDVQQQGFYWDDKLVAVWAASEMHPGCFSLGFVASKSWGAASKTISKHIQTVVKPDLIKKGMRRGMALSLASHAKAHRWMRWLGLHQEALLEAYGKSHEDFCLYTIHIN